MSQVRQRDEAYFPAGNNGRVRVAVQQVRERGAYGAAVHPAGLLARLPLLTVLKVTYLWVYETSHTNIIHELSVSAHTVADWSNFSREIRARVCVSRSEKLGGPGIEVEIDESRFGRHREESRWVLGGVERASSRKEGWGKCFLLVAEQRDRETLLKCVKDYILPGTTVYSDCWNSYDCLSHEEFRRLAADESIEFRETSGGVHNNAIQGTWGALKRALRGNTCKGQLESYLAEYIWRRTQRANRRHWMALFLTDIATVFKPKTCD